MKVSSRWKKSSKFSSKAACADGWKALYCLCLPLILASVAFAQALEIGQGAPDFRLRDIDGTHRTLAELRGSGALLLDFGSVFCFNCQETLSLLEEIRRAPAAFRLRVAAVNLDPAESASAVKAIARGIELGYPILLDPEGIVSTAYDVTQIPYLVLIDAKGIIRAIHRGSPSGLKEMILQKLGPSHGEK